MITKIYWSPFQRSKLGIILLSILSIIGLLFVETCKVKKEQSYFKKKLAASKLAERAFLAIRPELIKRKKSDSLEFDPTNSGLIGEFLTPITSNSGSLSAKQTSINPNFAALLIHYFKKLKLEEGDTIAVAVSGSFPALNISVYSAIQTLKLKPIIITSASASQFGANSPQMTWLDMERELYELGFFSFKSSYASMGGIQDKAVGLTKEGKDLILQAIKRNSIQYLDSKSYDDALESRIRIYDELSNQKPIKAFINVGGGTTILGTSLGKQVFKTGLIVSLPEEGHIPNSVISRFLERDIPVINLIQIETLAKKFGMPNSPKKIPKPGEGKIFYQEEYNPILYISVFLFIIFGLYGITRLGVGESQSDFSIPKSKGV